MILCSVGTVSAIQYEINETLVSVVLLWRYPTWEMVWNFTVPRLEAISTSLILGIMHLVNG